MSTDATTTTTTITTATTVAAVAAVATAAATYNLPPLSFHLANLLEARLQPTTKCKTVQAKHERHAPAPKAPVAIATDFRALLGQRH